MHDEPLTPGNLSQSATEHLDQRIVRVLETAPEPHIAADFAARVASRLPARHPVSLTPTHYGQRATLAGIFHPGAAREWLSVAEAGRTRVKERTIVFLENWNRLNQVEAPKQADLDALVRTQAVDNKPERSLLIKLPRERADWYGMGTLDYRWQTARRMLNDIVEVLPC